MGEQINKFKTIGEAFNVTTRIVRTLEKRIKHLEAKNSGEQKISKALQFIVKKGLYVEYMHSLGEQ
jgi:hypothetical protein